MVKAKKPVMLSVYNMLLQCSEAMTCVVTLQDGRTQSKACDLTVFNNIMNTNYAHYCRVNKISSIIVTAVIDKRTYTVLTVTPEGTGISPTILAMLKEWNVSGWAITAQHKRTLISELSAWMCDIEKNSALWVPTDDDNLMHYVHWVYNRVCWQDRNNPEFWSKFGFTDSEVKRIINC